MRALQCVEMQISDTSSKVRCTKAEVGWGFCMLNSLLIILMHLTFKYIL